MDIVKEPIDCVWEVTMGCNMHCMHCGSACDKALEDELTTEEAFKLIDQMKDVGLKSITLSGGEPTTRKDIFLLAERLNKNGILVSMISNGWLINEEMVEKAINAGLTNIFMSLDGMEDTHDTIRKKGAFKHVIRTLDILNKKNIYSGIITTINKMNINELTDIWELLRQKKVNFWQVQIALPMGNLKKNREQMLLEPEQIEIVVERMYEFAKSEGTENPKIYLGDNIGYYNIKDVEIRAMQTDEDTAIWAGCGAGKSGFGVLHNGDIVPCTSMRNKEYIEGNIRFVSLKYLWENGFKIFRNFSNAQLEGICYYCIYSEICRGGCSNSRYCLQGKLESENIFCLYNCEIKREYKMIANIIKFPDAKLQIEKLVNAEEFQLLNYYVNNLLKKNVYDIHEELYLMNMLAFSFFRLELFDKAIEINKKVLERDKSNLYAQKGLGISLYSYGEKSRGIAMLKECAEKTTIEFMEPYQDLITILRQEQNDIEANIFFEKAKQKNPDFVWINKCL